MRVNLPEGQALAQEEEEEKEEKSQAEEEKEKWREKQAGRQDAITQRAKIE